jgi:hypothetical protein
MSRVGSKHPTNVSTSPRGRQELPRLIPVGVQVWYDTKRLTDLGIRLKSIIDLSTLAKQHLPNSPSGYSICSTKALAEMHLDLGARSDSSDSWKPHPLAKYAALDAYNPIQSIFKAHSLSLVSEEGK